MFQWVLCKGAKYGLRAGGVHVLEMLVMLEVLGVRGGGVKRACGNINLTDVTMRREPNKFQPTLTE